jgi:hypothetical protein
MVPISDQQSEPRPTRKVKISFPGSDVSAVADLLEEDSEATSQAIWDLLPLRLPAVHDIWSGHLVLAHLDNSVQLRPENVLTYIPVPGDIFYYYRPPHYVRGDLYAPDTRPRGPRGPEAVNLFANISSGLEDFAQACEAMIRSGQREILIEKVEAL